MSASRAGPRPDAVQHRREPALHQRATVDDRYHGEQLPPRLLRDVDVVPQIGEGRGGARAPSRPSTGTPSTRPEARRRHARRPRRTRTSVPGRSRPVMCGAPLSTLDAPRPRYRNTGRGPSRVSAATARWGACAAARATPWPRLPASELACPALGDLTGRAPRRRRTADVRLRRARASRRRGRLRAVWRAPAIGSSATSAERQHALASRARVRAVEVPGPDRVLPGCAYFPACGGCQWQHVAPAAQRTAKQALVAEQLERLGGLRGRPRAPHDRRRSRLGLPRARVTLARRGPAGGTPPRARSHALVEVAACPIADPALSAHLESARAWLSRLRVPLRRLTIAAAPRRRRARRCGDGGAGSRRRGGRAVAVMRTAPSVRGTVLAGASTRLVTG